MFYMNIVMQSLKLRMKMVSRENINELSRWCIEIVDSFIENEDYDIRTWQFSGYGASFV